jgi:hypothetical protein
VPSIHADENQVYSRPAAVPTTKAHQRGLELLFLFWFDRSEAEFIKVANYTFSSTCTRISALFGAAMAQKQPLWHTENLVKAKGYLDMLAAMNWQSQTCSRQPISCYSITGSSDIDCSLIQTGIAYLDSSKPTPDRELEFMQRMEKIYNMDNSNLDLNALYAISILGQTLSAKPMVICSSKRLRIYCRDYMILILKLFSIPVSCMLSRMHMILLILTLRARDFNLDRD